MSLLGRDLICELGLSLVSTPEGLKVTKLDLNDVHSLVQLSVNTPLYVYNWKLPVGEITSHLLQAVRGVVSPTRTEFAPSGSIHCTSHLSLGPDAVYEQQWYRDGTNCERLITQHLYWSTHKSALSVALTRSQGELFTAWSTLCCAFVSCFCISLFGSSEHPIMTVKTVKKVSRRMEYSLFY